MQSVKFLTVVFTVHLIHVANVDGDDGRRQSPEHDTGIWAHGRRLGILGRRARRVSVPWLPCFLSSP